MATKAKVAEKKIEKIEEKVESTKDLKDAVLAKMTHAELISLVEEARSLAYDRQAEERQKGQKEFLESEKIKKGLEKLQELRAKYKELCKRKGTQTLMVPIKFEVDLEEEADLFDYISLYSCKLQIEDIFSPCLKGELDAKNSNLDKIQKVYIKESVAEFAENACESSLNLFPDLRKDMKALANAVSKVLEDIGPDLRGAGFDITHFRKQSPKVVKE